MVAHALYSYNAKPPAGFEACRRSGVRSVLSIVLHSIIVTHIEVLRGVEFEVSESIPMFMFDAPM